MANTISEQILATQAASLKGYWKCNEASGNLADSSGQANTLTATAFDAGDYSADGPGGLAIGPLNSANEYAIASASPLGTTIPNAFTMFAVVKYNSAAVAKAIISVGSNTDSSLVYLGDATTGDIVVRVRDAGTDIVNTTRDANMTNGTWYTIAVCCSGGNTLKLYLDGVQVGTDISFTLGTIDNIDRVLVGGSWAAGALFNCCDETIQHAAMWTTALTAAELLDIHNALRYHKIYPDGTEDFTTLQTAANVYDSTGGGTHTMECGAGDVGALTLGSTWTPTGLTIQAATAAKHTGIDAGTTGLAYSTGAFALTGMLGTVTLTVKDMRLQSSFVVNQNSTASGFTLTMERNMFKIAGNLTSVLSVTADPSSGAISVTTNIRNNVFYITSGTITNIILSDAIAGATETATIADAINNNTISITGGTISYGIRRRASAALTGTAQCTGAPKNNVAFGTASGGDLERELAGTGGTETVGNSGGYNATTDATQDEFGATGSLGSQTAADWLTAVATNGKLKLGANGIDAGSTIAGFSDDITDQTRPIGAAWEIGAFEYLPVGGGMVKVILGESVL